MPQLIWRYLTALLYYRTSVSCVALTEAGRRPSIPSVPVKSAEQQDIQAWHRVRARLVKNRTALVNHIRGLLLEYGVVIPQGLSRVRQRLAGFSKRGNSYLRCLLIHGARSVVSRARVKTDARSMWIQQLVGRVGINKACVAVANKMARVAWALLRTGEHYRQPERTPGQAA
jgi:transposase